MNMIRGNVRNAIILIIGAIKVSTSLKIAIVDVNCVAFHNHITAGMSPQEKLKYYEFERLDFS